MYKALAGEELRIIRDKSRQIKNLFLNTHYKSPKKYKTLEKGARDPNRHLH